MLDWEEYRVMSSTLNEIIIDRVKQFDCDYDNMVGPVLFGMLVTSWGLGWDNTKANLEPAVYLQESKERSVGVGELVTRIYSFIGKNSATASPPSDTLPDGIKMMLAPDERIPDHYLEDRMDLCVPWLQDFLNAPTNMTERIERLRLLPTDSNELKNREASLNMCAFTEYRGTPYSGHCFGTDELVTVGTDSEQCRIGDVKVGDLLYTTTPNDEVWYVHHGDGLVPLLCIKFSDSTSLRVTKHHLLSTPAGMRAAGDLQAGDALQKQTDGGLISFAEVVDITDTCGTVIAPITMSGMIRVNGVVASCYAYGTHDVMHLTLTPLRFLYRGSPQLATSIEHGGAALELHLIQSVAPALEQYMDAILVVAVLLALVLAIPLVIMSLVLGLTYSRCDYQSNSNISKRRVQSGLQTLPKSLLILSN